MKKAELLNLSTMGSQSFEDLKKSNEYGAEYWSARDLQPLLGYTQWRRFEQAITRAMESCTQSGNVAEDHFAGADKMIELGKGGQRDVPDYQLSRFACYLIAQNGDPRKPEIALAQKYFAIQTRRKEVSEKAKAGKIWCESASHYLQQHGGKPWKYLLIPHNEVKENFDMSLYVNRFEV